MFFYFVLIVNLTLVAVNGYLWIPRKLVWFLGYLIGSGAIGLVAGTVSPVALIKDLAGIIPCALYFGGFFRWMRFDIKMCFTFYAKLAFYAAVFGIFYLPFQSFPVGRLKSIFLEPSGYALVILPALFYYGDAWQRERRYGLRALTLLLSLVLTFSTLGFIGLLFGLYMFGIRYRFGKLLAPGFIAGLFVLTYSTVPLVRVRLDDAVVGAFQGDIGEINASTFGTVINYFVTRQAVASYPVFGGGLGSYIVFHDRYFPLVPGTQFVLDQERMTLGRWDASSLLLRIAAEFGLVGLAASFWFLWRYWPRKGSADQQSVAMAVLCYVIAKFVRDGIYFNPEVFFFFGAYAINGLLSTQHISQRKVSPGLPLQATTSLSAI